MEHPPQKIAENVTNPAPCALWTLRNQTHEILLDVEKNNISLASTWDARYVPSPVQPTMNRSEHPFLWQDKRSNWHFLTHNMVDIEEFDGRKYPRVGGHVFAQDWRGPWTYGKTIAYNTTAYFTDGTTVDLYRRERPKLFFNDDGDMTPLYLMNGVQDFNTSKSHTLIQPIGTKWAEYERGLGFNENFPPVL